MDIVFSSGNFLPPLWTSLLAGPCKPGSACCMTKRIKLLCRLFCKSFAEVLIWSMQCDKLSIWQSFLSFPHFVKEGLDDHHLVEIGKGLVDRRKKEHPIVVA